MARPDARMVAWARKYGIQSTIHTGGPSIPGSSLIDKDMVLETDADVIGHVNGGHTALARRSDRRALRTFTPRARDRSQRQRTRGIARAAHGERIEATAPRDSRHRFARRLRCSASRHSAHDLDAVVARRNPRRSGDLPGHGKYRKDAQPELRPDRSWSRSHISSSSTQRSNLPERTCSTAFKKETCPASAW